MPRDSAPSRHHVLLVEPDEDLRADVAHFLVQSRFEVEQAASGAVALAALARRTPDLVISELSLPDLSGFGLCRKLHEEDGTSRVPVVFTTHYAEEIDRVLSFEAGADDFLAKPFSLIELQARMRAILRRPRRARAPELERPRVVGWVMRELANATPREKQILAALAQREGHVVSREELLESVWEDEPRCELRTVDAHVTSLRRKLGPGRNWIRTVHGIGYRFEQSTG